MKKGIPLMAVGMALLLVPFLTLSAKKLSIGKKAPDFKLTDTNGAKHKLSDYKGKYVVLEWVNHGCPFVRKHYDTNNMQNLQKEIREKGVVWLSICSSAKGKQGHMSLEQWNKTIKEKGSHSNAVLIDEKGKIGKKYGAKTTPHMYIIDPEGNLVYQGAIDDKPSYEKEDVEGAVNYVRLAIEESLGGREISTPRTKPYGCSVKYK